MLHKLKNQNLWEMTSMYVIIFNKMKIRFVWNPGVEEVILTIIFHKRKFGGQKLIFRSLSYNFMWLLIVLHVFVY